jgi:hypothetical protein
MKPLRKISMPKSKSPKEGSVTGEERASLAHFNSLLPEGCPPATEDECHDWDTLNARVDKYEYDQLWSYARSNMNPQTTQELIKLGVTLSRLVRNNPLTVEQIVDEFCRVPYLRVVLLRTVICFPGEILPLEYFLKENEQQADRFLAQNEISRTQWEQVKIIGLLGRGLSVQLYWIQFKEMAEGLIHPLFLQPQSTEVANAS